MIPAIEGKHNPTLLAEAWNWVLRVQDESVSQEDLADWLRWYESEETHKAVFDELQAFWQQIDRVTDEPKPLPAELWLGGLALSPSEAEQLLAQDRNEPSHPRRFRRRPGRRRPPMPALAAGAAACVIGLLLVWPSVQRNLTHEGQPQQVVTASPMAPPPVAQVTTLPDGSRAELAPKSVLAVQYTPRQRLLQLQDGEGYFTVAHNKQRPFIVQVGPLRVRAVGTAFNVRSAGERTVVTVSDGTVEVYPASGEHARLTDPPNDAVRVTAGSEVTWTKNGPVVAMVDPTHALAWREGRLEYLNEPLASAVADLNRYSTHRIVIRDPTVGRIVFSGTVLTAATDAWVQSLPSLFPIEVQRDGDGNTVLVSRPSVPAHGGAP